MYFVHTVACGGAITTAVKMHYGSDQMCGTYWNAFVQAEFQ